MKILKILPATATAALVVFLLVAWTYVVHKPYEMELTECVERAQFCTVTTLDGRSSLAHVYHVPRVLVNSFEIVGR